jgi:hypothetical protein
MGMSARIKVVVAVAVSYALAFAPLLVSGPTGLWWVRLMVSFSLPLIAVACATSFLCARSIVQRPAVWTLAGFSGAVALSVLELYFPSRSWVGLVSVIVAAPAAMIFYLIARAWLRPKLAGI